MRQSLIAALVLALLLPASGAALAAQEEPPMAGMFVPTGSLESPRSLHAATLLQDGRVLVAGGSGVDDWMDYDVTTTEIWNPATGAFEPGGALAEGRHYHTTTLLPDGRVLVVGGAAYWNDGLSEMQVSSTEVWDPATRSWESAGSLARERMVHTATLLPDGRVLVVGGQGTEPRHRLTEVWDPASNTWGRAGSLRQARGWGHSATLLQDGRVLVVGGLTDEETASAEVWDPTADDWSPAGSLAQTRWQHSATLLPDGRVLVIGGLDEEWMLHGLAEIWDPATTAWSPAGMLAEARIGHSATLLSDGRVLVVGGDGVDKPGLAEAEVWDPATATFSPAGTLAKGRGGYYVAHSATRLPDGRVLVVGGTDWYDYTTERPIEEAIAEIWDPASDTWSPAGAYDPEAYRYHTATLLPDGRVLAVASLYLEEGLLSVVETWESVED